MHKNAQTWFMVHVLCSVCKDSLRIALVNFVRSFDPMTLTVKYCNRMDQCRVKMLLLHKHR